MIKPVLKVKLTLLFLLIISLTAGCMPEIRREPVMVSPQYRDLPAISEPVFSREIITGKISFLENFLTRDDINEDDRITAYELLSNYRTIDNVLANRGSDAASREIALLLYDSLDILDRRYFIPGSDEDRDRYTEAVNELTSIRETIHYLYFAGDFQGVIDRCVSMEDQFGPNSFNTETGIVFALSLAKKGRKDEAIQTGERIARDLEGKPDIIHLRAELIDWLISSGDRVKALALYEKLLDDLDEREAVLHSAKTRITAVDKPETVAETLYTEEYPDDNTDTRQIDMISQILGDVGQLVENNLFEEAKLLLLKARLRTEEEQDAETIDNALKTVEAAQERFYQNRETDNNSVRSVKELIESEKYDKAILRLDELAASSPEVNPSIETDDLRNLAVEGYIRSERERAAKIFHLAKQSNDIARKEELLLSSFQILNNLIEKYPSASLISRLNDNLESVKAELVKLKR